MSRNDFSDEEFAKLELIINSDSLVVFNDAMELWQKLRGLQTLLETVPIKNAKQQEAYNHVASAIDLSFEIFIQKLNGLRDDLRIALGLPV